MKKEELEEFLIEEKFDSYEAILQYVDDEKDIESLADKIKFLKNNGLENEDIEQILTENPLFLTSNLETVKRSVNFLNSIGLKKLSQVTAMNPELLSVSDKTMSDNYKLLKLIMTEKDLTNLLKIDCEILSFNTDYLGRRLEFFIKNDLKDKIKDIILNYIEAFEDEEDEIDIEILKKFGNGN
jgi:hypothetical protein